MIRLTPRNLRKGIITDENRENRTRHRLIRRCAGIREEKAVQKILIILKTKDIVSENSDQRSKTGVHAKNWRYRSAA